jgi:hypothetical protein
MSLLFLIPSLPFVSQRKMTLIMNDKCKVVLIKHPSEGKSDLMSLKKKSSIKLASLGKGSSSLQNLHHGIHLCFQPLIKSAFPQVPLFSENKNPSK